jgi:hypothetical protein
MLQPPWLSAHFVAWPIFVSPSLPLKLARSARPFGPVRRLPPLASIGTAAPPAAPPCRAPPTTALLHVRRAKLKHRHVAFTSPTESVSSRLLFPL